MKKLAYSATFNAWVRAILSFATLALFAYVVREVITGPDKGEGQVASVLLGALGMALGQVYNFYFGQSAKSEESISNDGPTGSPSDPISTNSTVTNVPSDPVPVSTEPPASSDEEDETLDP